MDTENPPLVLTNGYVYSTKVHIFFFGVLSFNYVTGNYNLCAAMSGSGRNGQEEQWRNYLPKDRFCLQLFGCGQGVYFVSSHFQDW